MEHSFLKTKNTKQIHLNHMKLTHHRLVFLFKDIKQQAHLVIKEDRPNPESKQTVKRVSNSTQN